jgi:hypothetical protein
MSTLQDNDDDGMKSPPTVLNNDADEDAAFEVRTNALERKLVRKIDLRLCTIAGILCSLNLLDSGIISSASVTSIFEDLGLGVGDRYVSCFFSLVWRSEVGLELELRGI